jgi:para-aminobenzoate N-oxygenase AurF
MKTIQEDSDYVPAVHRLIDLSINTYYNPYTRFEWPDSLIDDQWWMSRDLLTVFDTPFMERISERQLMALSKWESINFYSLNIHGIRELLLEVTKRIHSSGYEQHSEFFHHFIGEENEHMWFFAKFCLKYGGKVYPDKTVKIETGALEPDIETFLVFARIMIFEEIVDFFNSRMAKDNSLHPIIQEVNSVHHEDESRHIAFGRQLLKQLHSSLSSRYAPEELIEIGNYLNRYLDASIQSLYNPAVYRDAGIPDPYQFRRELLQYPSRMPQHERFLKRTKEFLEKTRILPSEAGYAAN